ncbi:MAG: hypothetical protein IPO69_09025 [Saprospiraceae bacterium]|nr:hypothetical protein [Saprospiraceae bacterium]
MPQGKGIYSSNGEKNEGLLCDLARRGFGEMILYRSLHLRWPMDQQICAKGGTLIHENGEKVTTQWYEDQPLSSEGSSFDQSKYNTFFTKYTPHPNLNT